ncbi:MAG: flotillin-like FloA family protein, partial [Selenomonadaceae bacterium]|nr:flotillin-like FloA family protein [Selenomonadaceae bacterium]
MISSIFFLLMAIIFIALFLHFVPLRLWIAARAANVPLNIITLVGMRMRQVTPSKIVM